MKKLHHNIDFFSDFVMTRLSNGPVIHKDHMLHCRDFQFYKIFPYIGYFMSAVFDWCAAIWFCEVMLQPKTDVVSDISCFRH